MKKSLLIQTAAALMIAAIALMGCKKDDDPVTDYRDGFEGTYNTDVSGNISITDLGIRQPLSKETAITVLKSSNPRMLTLNIDGEIMSVTVEEDGSLQIPSESYTTTQEEDGITLIMNITVSYTGTITDSMLKLNGTISGKATITDGYDTYSLPITGSVIYSGTK